MNQSCKVRSDLPMLVAKRYTPQTAERTLDAPELLDDYYLNILDWWVNDVASVALGDSFYFWDASTGSISELMTVEEDVGPVTSVNWGPDGRHVAVGLTNSAVHLSDLSSNKEKLIVDTVTTPKQFLGSICAAFCYVAILTSQLAFRQWY